MRKLFGIIFGLIISANVGLAASGLLTTDSYADMIDILFQEANVEVFDHEKEGISDLSLAEKPFENLYLFMYQNVKLYPRTASFQELAKKTVYNEEEIEAIVLYGDFTPIIIYFEEMGFRQKQDLIGQEYFLIQEMYDTELQFQIENYSLSYEAYAKEIFMNGDTTDSANIDLLFDLDIIHYLLFGEFFAPIDRAVEDEEDENVSLASEAVFEERMDMILLASEDEIIDTTDPLICSGDETLADAISAFEEYLATLPPKEEAEKKSGDGDVTGGGDGVSDTEKVRDRSIEERKSVEDFVKDLGGIKGNWARELPCGEVFCITLNLVTGAVTPTDIPEQEFEPEQNCIACHVAFILEKMEEMLANSLIVNKVPMNVLEDGTCKEAGMLIDLDLNVYLVKKPIVLDPGDDIEGIPKDNVEDLQATLISSGHIPIPGSRSKKTRDEIDFENLAYFKGEGTQEDLLNAAIKRQEIRAKAVAEAYEEFLNHSEGDNSLILYEQMSAELSSFFSYIQSFQEKLKDTYVTDEAPLIGLLNTNYCK